jgi:hypothetical protein
MDTGLIRCVDCHNEISVIAKTLLHCTRKLLNLWFQAIWHITSQKFRGCALGLRRVLGLNSMLICLVSIELLHDYIKSARLVILGY